MTKLKYILVLLICPTVLAWNPIAVYHPETDPCFLIHSVYKVTDTNISHWDLAYTWTIEFNEADPCFALWLPADQNNIKKTDGNYVGDPCFALLGVPYVGAVKDVNLEDSNFTTDGTVTFNGAVDVNGGIDVNAVSRFGDGGVTNYMQISSIGEVNFVGTAGLLIPHMMQSDSTDQAILSAANAQVINFNTDVHHSRITRTDSNTFTIIRPGSYLICFSGVTMGVINEYIHVWLRINGTDVANSNTIYQYKSNNGTAIVAVSFVQHFEVGDYFQFWTWGTSVNDKWDATAALSTPTRPACPSIIMTANYIGKD